MILFVLLEDVMSVKNAVHIHVVGPFICVMIMVDDIYEEYTYREWSDVIREHPIMLTTWGDVHIFVRG